MVKPEYRYYKEHGSFYFRNESGTDIQLMADEIAVGFFYDVADGQEELIILKHGTPETVRRWRDSMTGKPAILGTPMMVSSDKWDVNRLNFYLDCSGGFAVFLRELGLLPPLPESEARALLAR